MSRPALPSLRGASANDSPAPAAEGGWNLPGWNKLVGEAKPLTKTEADLLRPGLHKALKAYWRYSDEAITHTNRERAEARIWREIDDEDTATLVALLLTTSMRSVAAAQIVRGISGLWRYVEVGVILGPRFYQTVRFYAEHGGLAL